MGVPGWDQQDAPPSRGGGGQVAANYYDPVGEDELAQFDQAWTQTQIKEPGGFGPQHPDGKYLVQLEIARMERSKQRGTPMLVLGFEIVEGPSSGEIMHRRVIGNADQAGYVRQDLHNLGIDPPLLSQIEQYLPAAIGTYAEIVLKTKAGNDGQNRQNVYINRTIPPDQIGATLGDTAEAPF